MHLDESEEVHLGESENWLRLRKERMSCIMKKGEMNCILRTVRKKNIRKKRRMIYM